MRVGLEVLRLRLFPPRHAGWDISRQRIKKLLQNLLKNYVNRAHPPRMCPVMIINNVLWLIIRRGRGRGLLWKAIGKSPAPLLFKRSLFNQLAPDLLGTLVSLSAPTQWVDPYGKKGWVFQTPFEIRFNPFCRSSQSLSWLQGNVSISSQCLRKYISVCHFNEAAITVFFFFYFPPVDSVEWPDGRDSNLRDLQLSSLPSSTPSSALVFRSL